MSPPVGKQRRSSASSSAKELFWVGSVRVPLSFLRAKSQVLECSPKLEMLATPLLVFAWRGTACDFRNESSFGA